MSKPEIWIPSSVKETERRVEQEKRGIHADGSFTLCPEAYDLLKDLFRNSHDPAGGGIQLPPSVHYERVQKLRQAIYENQGVEFETYT